MFVTRRKNLTNGKVVPPLWPKNARLVRHIFLRAVLKTLAVVVVDAGCSCSGVVHVDDVVNTSFVCFFFQTIYDLILKSQ